mgnify:CR=1 FL=1
MKKIILGRAGTQPFDINGSSVSNEHAEIVIDDNGMWILKDLNSTNGTFVRDESSGELKRVSTISIHPMSFICLGTDNSHGCTFYARQILNPGDYIDELTYMNEKEDEYEKAVRELDRKTRLIKKTVFFVSLGVVLLSCTDMNTVSGWRLQLLRIGPLLSSFFTSFYDAIKEKKRLSDKYDRFRHCPNPACSHKMRTSEIRSMDCMKCHCH